MSSTPVDRLVAILERTQTTRYQRPRRKPDPTNTVPRKAPRKNAKQMTVETLQEARVLLESGWVRHEIAVDESEHPVPADSPHATAWCMSGALQAASYKVGFPGTVASTQRIERAAKVILDANELHPNSNEHAVSAIARTNDGLHSKEEVLAAIDKAIASLSQEG